MKRALVTGASSGIGRATVRRLAKDGVEVHALARRTERLAELGEEVGAKPVVADLQDSEAVTSALAGLPAMDAVVHCAGGARGRDPIVSADSQEWDWMWRTNVAGTMHLLREVVPPMVDRGQGSVVSVTSVAAHECLDGSGGYSTSKHAQAAILSTLRGELLGTGVRVTEVAPGLVETEFFEHRHPDDPEAAARPFAGLTPLSPEDVADSICHALVQPPHVNIDQIVLRPVNQGSNGRFHRS